MSLMIKSILLSAVLASSLLLVGCEDDAPEDVTAEFPLPEGLKDCKVYEVRYLMVVRCPNSITSTRVPMGKSSQTHIVVEKEFEVKHPEPERPVEPPRATRWVQIDGVMYQEVVKGN